MDPVQGRKGEIHTIGDAPAPAAAPTGEIHVVGGPEEVEDDSEPGIVPEADDAVDETQSEPVVETAEAITAEIDAPVPRDVPTEGDSDEPVEGGDA